MRHTILTTMEGKSGSRFLTRAQATILVFGLGFLFGFLLSPERLLAIFSSPAIDPAIDIDAPEVPPTSPIVPTASASTGQTPRTAPKPVPTPEPTSPAPTAPNPAPSAPPPELPPPPPSPAPQPPRVSEEIFSDSFAAYADGVITNEYAYWNPNDWDAKKSDAWEMTAGTLFARGGAAWTGIPDSGTAPDRTSSNANNSGIFRLTTKRADFGDVKVSFDLNLHKLTSTSHTPAVDWDGAHVFLRYQSQYHLYYASVNRRDDAVVIKKKVPNGPSNGGTYHNLSTYNTHEVPYGAWQHIEATVQNESDGSVTIEIYADGKLLARAVDNGIGGAPIRNPGKIGIRGDNAEMSFKNFVVEAL